MTADHAARAVELLTDARATSVSIREACRNCGRLAIDHTPGRYSVYGICPVDDPTHTNPITVHGIPAEDHHAHVCPVRRVREEKP